MPTNRNHDTVNPYTSTSIKSSVCTMCTISTMYTMYTNSTMCTMCTISTLYTSCTISTMYTTCTSPQNVVHQNLRIKTSSLTESTFTMLHSRS